MAELVDALVSNTSGSNTVPVRSRLRVLKTERVCERERAYSLLFSSLSLSHSHLFCFSGSEHPRFCFPYLFLNILLIDLVNKIPGTFDHRKSVPLCGSVTIDISCCFRYP